MLLRVITNPLRIQLRDFFFICRERTYDSERRERSDYDEPRFEAWQHQHCQEDGGCEGTRKEVGDDRVYRSVPSIVEPLPQLDLIVAHEAAGDSMRRGISRSMTSPGIGSRRGTA